MSTGMQGAQATPHIKPDKNSSHPPFGRVESEERANGEGFDTTFIGFKN